ncbi:MAG: twin-arginine translocation signal domain-containing protein, partial [Pedobacter sp.]
MESNRRDFIKGLGLISAAAGLNN